MSFTQETDHKGEALDKLISQYVDKPAIKAILESSADQIQELEDVFFELLNLRILENAEGYQLDRIGVIVGQDRISLPDDQYRILLYVKIGKNISQGESERIISVFQLLTQSSLVHLQNLESAEILLGTAAEIDPGLVDFVYKNMSDVVSGGVRISHIYSFDEDEGFAFDGGPGTALGFGTVTDPNEGGKFARLQSRTTPFAFDGPDNSSAGFGTLGDPIVGGRMEGL